MLLLKLLGNNSVLVPEGPSNVVASQSVRNNNVLTPGGVEHRWIFLLLETTELLIPEGSSSIVASFVARNNDALGP